MGIAGLYRRFDNFAHKIFSTRFAIKASKHYKEMYEKNGIQYRKLNNEQKKKVKNLWKTTDYSTHELYYSLTREFDEKICPELVFRTRIEPKLNDKRVTFAWDDKAFFERFLPDVPFPKTIIRNVGGGISDDRFNPISLEYATKMITKNLPVIIKPSRDSGLGRNVSRISGVNDIEQTLKKFGKDYVVQKTIRLCPELQKVSPNSVCVMRVITAIIDGKSQMLSACLRLNTEENAVADNQITEDGKGMLVIGITKDGMLKKDGVYSCGERIDRLPNGVEFCGIKIPKYEEALAIIRDAHLQIPMFKIVGWDITIDEEYNPIVIEYNLKGMGIYYYQLVNGPLFGEYTNNIINL